MAQCTQEPILELLFALDDICARDGPGPRPGSPADAEITTFKRPESVQTAYALGFMALNSARDHLEAVNLIVHLGQPSVAHWTSMRGLLEAASIASWQLDRKADSRERVSRSFAIRFDSLTHRRKLAQLHGNNSEVLTIDARLDDIEKMALGLGFAPLRNRKGKRDGIGQRKPTISDLAEMEYDFRKVYGALSAVAHCDPMAVAEAGFAKSSPTGGSWVPVRRVVQQTDLHLFLANAVTLFAHPQWMLTRQYGFDAAGTALALEAAYTKLGLDDNDLVRFWRTS
jgi:hypothetical protein